METVSQLAQSLNTTQQNHINFDQEITSLKIHSSFNTIWLISKRSKQTTYMAVRNTALQASWLENRHFSGLKTLPGGCHACEKMNLKKWKTRFFWKNLKNTQQTQHCSRAPVRRNEMWSEVCQQIALWNLVRQTLNMFEFSRYMTSSKMFIVCWQIQTDFLDIFLQTKITDDGPRFLRFRCFANSPWRAVMRCTQ